MLPWAVINESQYFWDSNTFGGATGEGMSSLCGDITSTCAGRRMGTAHRSYHSQIWTRQASHSFVCTPLVSCHLSIMHWRAMQCSSIIPRAEEGRKGERTTLTPCPVFLMPEIEYKASHTPGKHCTTGLHSQPSCFQYSFSLVYCFVMMEFCIVLLCLKALSQSVIARWYESLEEDNDFLLWGTGAPFGTTS